MREDKVLTARLGKELEAAIARNAPEYHLAVAVIHVRADRTRARLRIAD